MAAARTASPGSTTPGGSSKVKAAGKARWAVPKEVKKRRKDEQDEGERDKDKSEVAEKGKAEDDKDLDNIDEEEEEEKNDDDGDEKDDIWDEEGEDAHLPPQTAGGTPQHTGPSGLETPKDAKKKKKDEQEEGEKGEAVDDRDLDDSNQDWEEEVKEDAKGEEEKAKNQLEGSEAIVLEEPPDRRRPPKDSQPGVIHTWGLFRGQGCWRNPKGRHQGGREEDEGRTGGGGEE